MADGELVTLVDPSGYGNPTLPRMIAGLGDAPDGHVLIDDKVDLELHSREPDVAVVSQNHAPIRIDGGTKTWASA
jgi:ABC-type sugar transport system ATPase subunit